MLKKILTILQEKKQLRSVLLLVSGTAGAQAILVLALPILTRIYSPEDFSTLSVYVAILGIISTAACLRLDLAIPLPENDSEAINLLALALFFSLTTSVITSLLLLLLPNNSIRNLLTPALFDYVWLLPLGVFLSSTYNALQYWATRKKLFPTITRTRLEQSIAAVSTQIGLGYITQTPLILILGQILNSSAGIFRLASNVIKLEKNILRSISPHSMYRALGNYKDFPKYSTFESLANTAGIQLPFIIIASTVVGPEAGCLMLASRILQAPLSLLGSAVAQVYLTHAPQACRDGTLSTLTYKTLVNLMKAGVGPLIFLGSLSPMIFPYIFGEEWSRAGKLAAWITPWVVLQFISSPISMVGHILGRQKLMLYLTLLGFILRTGGVIYLSYAIKSPYVSEYYAVSGAIFYLICLLTFTTHASISKKQIFQAVFESKNYITPWLLAGGAASYLVKWLT